MPPSGQPNSLAIPREPPENSYWADLLVTTWVLFVGLVLCGVITLAGFPLGWSEADADSVVTAPGATSTMQASAASQSPAEGRIQAR